MTTRTSPETVPEIVSNGLCSGCGLCASIAGEGSISMGINLNGNMRPLLTGELDADTNAKILSVCPGVSVTGPGNAPGVPVHPTWGPVTELHRTWAVDESVRFRAAAGGTLTALGRYLLDTGEVEAVVHVRTSTEVPWLTEAAVSRTADEMLAGAQSRYGPAAPLVHVAQLLDSGTRFAVVAKPCDISAIRALGRTDPRVEAQIPYLLTIFCGGIHHAHLPKAMIRHRGVRESEVEVFQYRGEGWPGPTRVRTKDGVDHDMTYRQTWLEPAPWRYELQFRCKICPDAIGEVADVSAPDGWVLKDGRPIHEEAPGVNACLVRTERGRELVHRAVEAGYLAKAPLSFDEVDQMHINHPPRKLGWPGTQLALAVLRQPRLRIKGYRPLITLRAAGFKLEWKQFSGMIRRVVRRDNRESAL